ncbi:MAG TPA: glycoside hydrolase family 38 C-terminal domain-containing protein, partial [Gaiellaceae bacterium]|nr:glycoside hydrolase family 38 C-terminal domain-containing protein [Gaiellaceae bacterium]
PYTLATRRDAPPAERHEVVTQTPLRAEVAFERPLGVSSSMRQAVRLDAGSRRLEFHTEVDWHESHTLLKACFPLTVRAPYATYEMQFGYAERPTHGSTSYDRAKYEVPGHRFADLSEHGFGAALLTDSKYGYSCLGGDLRVSLLRSSKSPDPEADMGRHVFAYALVPHAGGWRDAGIVAEAALFNAPLVWTDASWAGSFASVEGGLVLDTVKRAEGSDAIVLRLYEPHGGRGVARVSLAVPFTSARRASLLEEPGEEVDLESLEFRPHEVITLLVA